jgi:hypothetical protein
MSDVGVLLAGLLRGLDAEAWRDSRYPPAAISRTPASPWGDGASPTCNAQGGTPSYHDRGGLGEKLRLTPLTNSQAVTTRNTGVAPRYGTVRESCETLRAVWYRT